MSAGAAPPMDGFSSGVSLEALFRSNAAAKPGATALAGPSGRAGFADGAPRFLTYAEADAEIDRLARRLLSFGLPDGSVVAVQLPNIVEATITLLAILRAGMVAAPVPMPWRRSDVVAGLRAVEPKALVTLARWGDERPAIVACEAAAELFSLSFPCAFGDTVPDGMIALDREETAVGTAPAPLPSATGERIAIATFDAAASGYFAVARTHSQWLALGLATMLEAQIRSCDTVVSVVPPISLAGIGAAVVPWLLSGGTLALTPAVAATIGQDRTDERSHLLAPAGAVGALLSQPEISLASCIAVYRSANVRVPGLSRATSANLVDLITFGELGAVVMRRTERARPRAVPLGAITAPVGGEGGPVVIETANNDGQLMLRGPMVPAGPYPDDGKAHFPAKDAAGFLHSEYRCRADGAGGLVVDGGPRRVATVGGLRFGLDDLESRIAQHIGPVNVSSVGDPLLGDRLRIETEDPAADAAALHANGHTQLVVEAVAGSPLKRRAAG